MTLRRVALASALAAALTALAPARECAAFDFKVRGESLRLDLTESMFMSARLDTGNGELNRDAAGNLLLDANGNPTCARGDCTDDNYGELINRLNAQLAWKRFLFSIRFDTGAWVHTPNPRLLMNRAGTQNLQDTPFRFHSAGTRVQRGPVPLGVTPFYLEKFSASYIGRSIEITLGDFYANIGRGMVLSVRKFDELGIDTTITGGKLIVHHGDFSAIALAGFTNVQNIDAARAQWVPDSNDFITAAHVDYRFLRKLTVGAHVMWGRPSCPAGAGTCDEEHPNDKPFAYEYRLRPGLSIDAPRITSWLGIYAEYARQEDGYATTDPEHAETQRGNAFYGSANLYLGDVSLLIESKYYDNYQPWTATVNPFTNLTYTVPPNLERFIVPPANNTDILAGRATATARMSPNATVFVSGQVGRSHAPGVETTNSVLLDLYLGAQLRWDEGRSHFFPLVEMRNDHQDSNPATGVLPETEERIVAIEWDLMQDLPRRLSVELQGLLWLRQKTPPSMHGESSQAWCYDRGPADPAVDNRWCEANIYLSLRWASKLVVAAGYEFTSNVGERENKHHFFNGSVLWNITSSTSVMMFAGGNRPGLKCVSGVCRTFPAFEGVRLELVVRL